jgi:hypothetical protein
MFMETDSRLFEGATQLNRLLAFQILHIVNELCNRFETKSGFLALKYDAS